MKPNEEERFLPLAENLGLGVLINRPVVNGTCLPRVNGRHPPELVAAFDCASWAPC